MEKNEFRDVWTRIVALWPSWAAKMAQPEFTANEWAKALRRFSRQAVEQEISRYYLEHSTKYQPDLAVIVEALFRGERRSPPDADHRFHAMDRHDQLWYMASSEAEAAMRAETEPERARHRAALRILAMQAVRLATAWHAERLRLEEGADPWPPGEPEAQERIRRNTALITERWRCMAERLLAMAGMQRTILDEALSSSCPHPPSSTNALSKVVSQVWRTCARTGPRGRG